jgi:hypothetical protein
MFVSPEYDNPLQSTKTGHTLPWAANGIFRIPSYLVDDFPPEESTLRPSPGMGQAFNAIFAESARLEAQQRDDLLPAELLTSLPVGWIGPPIPGAPGKRGGVYLPPELRAKLLALLEGAEDDQPKPPKAPSNLGELIRSKIEEIDPLRKEVWIRVDGRKSFNHAGTPKAERHDHPYEIPPAEDGKCKGKWEERYVQGEVSYHFVLWEHNYGTVIRRISGPDTSADESEKQDNLVKQCESEIGAVRKEVNEQADNIEYQRELAELERDLAKNGFPPSWIQAAVESWLTNISCPANCVRTVKITGSASEVELAGTKTYCNTVPDGEPYVADVLDKDGNVIYGRNEAGERVPLKVTLQKYRIVIQIYIDMDISYAVYARVTCNDK